LSKDHLLVVEKLLLVVVLVGGSTELLTPFGISLRSLLAKKVPEERWTN
jgi:hypothetical protein